MRGFRLLLLIGLVSALVAVAGQPGGETTAGGYVPPASPPPEFAATFDELSQTLTAFEADLDAGWDGGVTDGQFAGALSVANGNKSVALLAPATWTNVLSMLDAYEAMGVGMIKIDVEYPVFTPAFQAYLAAHNPPAIPGYNYIVANFIGTPNSFYNKLTTEIRSRGMGLWIEYGTLFEDYSPTPPSAYFADMRTAGLAATQVRYTQERSAETALLVQQLQPDYFTILEEPDTQAMNFGYFPGGVPIFSDPASWGNFVDSTVAAVATVAPNTSTLLGAGAGVWTGEEYYTEFAAMPALDFVDLHSYPFCSLTRNYLDTLVEYIDNMRAIAPGKSFMIGEAWTYKTTCAEISAGVDFNEILGRDVYSFWEPIDRQFLEVLWKLMHAKNVSGVMPFWATYYFTYLTHGDPALGGLTPIEKLALAGQQSLANIESVTLTGTAEKFTELVAIPPDADGDSVPDSADSSDTDGDGTPDNADACPQYATTWPVPPGDSDCDGFPDSVAIGPPNSLASEAGMVTHATRRCANNTTRNDEPFRDRWPVDFDDNQTVNGSDLLTFAPNLFPAYNARWDLSGDGKVNGSDFLKMAPFFGKTCV